MKPTISLFLKAMSAAALVAAFVVVMVAAMPPGPDIPDEVLENTEQQPKYDVPYVPTPQEVVEEMLNIASVGSSDFLIDLGSGDGRIVITAAQQYGTRGMGVELNPALVERSKRAAAEAGVADRVAFVLGDLFDTDIRQATVITMYLLPEVNLRLRPRLFEELKPGTRIVSHDFDMAEWDPDKHVDAGPHNGLHYVYFWVIPAQVAGTWALEAKPVLAPVQLSVTQTFQKIAIIAQKDGRPLPLRDARMDGDRISFFLNVPGQDKPLRFEGLVDGNRIAGTAVSETAPPISWQARRN